MISKKSVIYRFLCIWWVLINMAPRKMGCLRYTKFCWVGKHGKIIKKPTNSPTQGQPNPKKEKLDQKWHLGHFFFLPHSNHFFVGWD